MEGICWLLQNNLDFEKSLSSPQITRIPFIDIGLNEDFLDEFPSPRTFKSHAPVIFMPENFNNNAKV